MQPTLQNNPAVATQQALQKAKAGPSSAPATKPGQVNVTGPQPQQPQQPNQQGGGMDSFDSEITENLQQHLNSLDPRQQKFLADALQHYANIVIPCLGIVCGSEVFQYFVQLYQTHFAKVLNKQPPGQQPPNSAPAPQGQQPNQGAPQPQPQQAQAQQPPAQQSPQQ
jgi:hypothetical protein